MARVTVEDCLEHVDNRFELVLLATKRARQIANGQEAMVELENDKPTVLALREIADGFVTRDILTEKEEVVEEEELLAEGEKAIQEEMSHPSDEIIEATAENPVLKNEDE